MGRLEQWHPGYGIKLETSGPLPDFLQGKHYTIINGWLSLDTATLSDKQQERLKWTHNLLTLTQSRPGQFACHGMHEWAMVYSGADIRHRESAPLRFSQEETDRIVESRPICCSHFDAYRFFSPAALKFNKLRPTLDNRPDFEQPGCLHTNMDLYKWASKCMPWVGSDLLWQCFQLALKARELDMRASPYDLREYGYNAIPIETEAGQEQYETLQRQIAKDAAPLRKRLISTLAQIV